MVHGNHKEVSLYEEAKAGLSSLMQQTATVFVCFVIMLLSAGGAPSSFLLAWSFFLGTAYVAWSEQNRIEKLRTPAQKIVFGLGTAFAARRDQSRIKKLITQAKKNLIEVKVISDNLQQELLSKVGIVFIFEYTVNTKHLTYRICQIISEKPLYKINSATRRYVHKYFVKVEKEIPTHYLYQALSEEKTLPDELFSKLLINVLQENPDACIQFGDRLLFVKTTDANGKSMVRSRILTVQELMLLNENPSMLSCPDRILEWLDGEQDKPLLGD